MLILPAIDILDGKCVRLKQGDFNKKIVYSDRPEEIAVKWQNEGAKFLHVVDLDGAKEGAPVNIFQIKNILEAVTIPVEVGGGIRTMQDVEDMLELGVERVIVGSSAVKDPEFVREAAEHFGEQMIVGIDARDGIVAVDGWSESGEIQAEELAARIGDFGILTMIYTDISRDGMMSGVNAEKFADMAKKSGMSVIASGGVTSLDDIRALKQYESVGVTGAIIGKALYENKLNLKAAMEIAE